MRYPRILSLIVISGALAACGSDSTKESSIACSGGSPDLAGTWNLYSLDVGFGAISSPPATGTFVFHGDSVDVDLTIPSPPAPQTIAIVGSGSCRLSGTNKIAINSNSQVLGSATGTYTLNVTPGANVPDTLTATLQASGQTITAVVTR